MIFMFTLISREASHRNRAQTRFTNAVCPEPESFSHAQLGLDHESDTNCQGQHTLYLSLHWYNVVYFGHKTLMFLVSLQMFIPMEIIVLFDTINLFIPQLM